MDQDLEELECLHERTSSSVLNSSEAFGTEENSEVGVGSNELGCNWCSSTSLPYPEKKAWAPKQPQWRASITRRMVSRQYLSDSEAESPPRRQFRIVDVDSIPWGISVGIAVLLNSFLIGWEIDHPSELCHTAETIFSIFFAFELLVRIFEKRENFFWDCEGHQDSHSHHDSTSDWKWNWFDMVVVAFTLMDRWLYVLNVNPAILRLLRVIRLVRLVRLLRSFQALAVIAEGFFKSLESVMWISTIVLTLVFGCATVTTRLIGRAEPYNEKLDRWFGTMGRSMLTLFEMVTLDGWASKATEVMNDHGWGWGLFFCGFIMIASYTCLALITAVITDQTIEAIHEDREYKARRQEEKQRNLQRTVSRLFNALHKDAEGKVSKEVLLEKVTEDIRFAEELSLAGCSVQPNEIEELFEMLDTDRSGSIDVDEFSMGFAKLHGIAKSKDLYAHKRALQNQLDSVSCQLQEIRQLIAASSVSGSAPVGPSRLRRQTSQALTVPGSERGPGELLQEALIAVRALRGNTPLLQQIILEAAAALQDGKS